jgi:hypothetical protein
LFLLWVISLMPLAWQAARRFLTIQPRQSTVWVEAWTAVAPWPIAMTPVVRKEQAAAQHQGGRQCEQQGYTTKHK